MENEQAAIEQEDLSVIRAEIAGKVFSDETVPPVDPQVAVESEQPASETPENNKVEDPWAGVSPALRDQFNQMAARLSDFDKITFQIKQAERRIGSLQNEFHVAKKAAESVAKAPTAEEVAAAANNKKAWDDLKEEFPDWGTAIEGRLAAERAEVLQASADALKTEIEGKTGQAEARLLEKLASTERKLEATRLQLRHGDFTEVVKSDEYAAWINTQPENVRQAAATSNDADVASQILDAYKTSPSYSAWASKNLPPTKSAQSIVADRQQRLRQAQTIQGRQSPPIKSEADMTEEELRRSIAAKVWKKKGT